MYPWDICPPAVTLIKELKYKKEASTKNDVYTSLNRILINNMNYMRILDTEPSSVIHSQTK